MRGKAVIWDPRDTGDDDEIEPAPRWVFIVALVLWVALAACLLLVFTEARGAQPAPFAVVLPDGRETVACGLRYAVPPAKLITLEPCLVVFADSFEGMP